MVGLDRVADDQGQAGIGEIQEPFRCRHDNVQMRRARHGLFLAFHDIVILRVNDIDGFVQFFVRQADHLFFSHSSWRKILHELALPLLLTGCATTGNYQTYKAPKTVIAAAPVENIETAKAEPGKTWVHGEWKWDGNSWVWSPGYWE